MQEIFGENAIKQGLAAVKESEATIKRCQGLLNGELKGYFEDLSIGAVAPRVVSKDLEGNIVALTRYKGKVVVLDFWATWCGPCVQMIPHSTKLVQKMKGRPFAFIGISIDDSPAEVKAYLKKTPMPWAQWHEGPESKMLASWDVRAVPTIYVLDHKGVIRYKPVTNEQLEEAVEKLLEECETEQSSAKKPSR